MVQIQIRHDPFCSGLLLQFESFGIPDHAFLLTGGYGIGYLQLWGARLSRFFGEYLQVANVLARNQIIHWLAVPDAELMPGGFAVQQFLDVHSQLFLSGRSLIGIDHGGLRHCFVANASVIYHLSGEPAVRCDRAGSRALFPVIPWICGGQKPPELILRADSFPCGFVCV